MPLPPLLKGPQATVPDRAGLRQYGSHVYQSTAKGQISLKRQASIAKERPALPSTALNGDPLLSVDDVAELAGLHPEVVRRAIRRDELKASKLCSRFRIRPSDYEAWIDASRFES